MSWLPPDYTEVSFLNIKKTSKTSRVELFTFHINFYETLKYFKLLNL